MTDLKKTARITGVLYLGLAIAGALGFLLVRAALHVDGNAAATANNLADHGGLARLGVALELGIVLTQALAAVWFYKLFRALNSFAAGSLAAFGLVNAVAIAQQRRRVLDDRVPAVCWSTTADGYVVGFTRGRSQPCGQVSPEAGRTSCPPWPTPAYRTAVHQTNQQEVQNLMVGASTVQSLFPHSTLAVLAESRHLVDAAPSLVLWTVR